MIKNLAVVAGGGALAFALAGAVSPAVAGGSASPAGVAAGPVLAAKTGDVHIGSATVNESDLRAAAPFLQSVTPVASADGRLTLRGTATLLGLSATVDATVSAQNGKLVVVPDVPFGGLATITVFSDPRIQVQGVSASPAPGGFAVRGTAVVR